MHKLTYFIILVAFCLATENALACEPLLNTTENPPITYAQADQLLGTVLLSDVNARDSESPVAQMLDSIDCYLAEQEVSNKILSTTRLELNRLGKLTTDAISLENKRTAIAAINTGVNRDTGTGFVQFPSAPQQTVELDLFADILKPSCTDVATEKCSNALALATNLWWINGYFRGLSDTLNNKDIANSLQFNDRLERMWRSYKDDTILLWPQEVLLNSLVYKPNSQGLSEPPSYKLLSLRPSLGLSYFSDQNDHVLPSINIDLLGVYWWRYGGVDGASAEPGRGIAASIIWDGSDTALGLTYHHSPKWSATIAHGDKNDVVLSISMQLGWWLLKR